MARPPTRVRPQDLRSMRSPSLTSSQKVPTQRSGRVSRPSSLACSTPPMRACATRRATASDHGPLEGVTFATTPPIVVVVFDQLPLISLLDRDGRIDGTLYPNFAALSRDAAWFRNASAVGDMTNWALPAILTGNYPTGPTSGRARPSREPLYSRRFAIPRSGTRTTDRFVSGDDL